MSAAEFPIGEVFDGLTVEVVVLSGDGTVVYSNGAWRAFGEENGNPDPDSIGENYLEVCRAALDDPGARTVYEGLRSLLRGDREYFRSTYPCHSPEERRWFDLYAWRFDVDGETYALMLHTNVTARAEADIEIREEAARLEALNRIIAHDLRNPLSVAHGYLTLLADDVDSEYLDPIESSIQRTWAVLDNAATLAEGTEVTQLEGVDLRERARHVWASTGADESALVVEADPTVEADAALLDQLLENLFRNAIVHGGPTVEVTVGPLDDGFYVADDGAGIDAEDRTHVFEPGYTTGGGGTGFGLDIVRRIVRAHGWRIEVGRSERGGAKFEIRTGEDA